jgi:FKBP-type peptidyl-prolyl cis-trans isomerase FkpA
MKVRYLFLFFIALTIGVSSCKKNFSVDPVKQLAIDTNLIKAYLVKNNITATHHSSGVYYKIITAGSGTTAYTLNTSVSALYTGRLLNGTIFDAATTNPISFKLGGVIQGWQIGIPLIQKGGKIRLFIPSGYGYGDLDAGKIPANSVLDFDVELVDVQN